MSNPAYSARVTILGSGTCVPSLTRSSCAVLVETVTHKFLLDVGAGTMRRMLEVGITIADLDYLLLSHFHPDHTGELVPLLFASKYAPLPQRHTPLSLVGGPGLRHFWDGLKAVYGSWIDLGADRLLINELNTDTHQKVEGAPITITSAPMQHSPESVAYRLTSPSGATVVYSGDTDDCENLVSLAQDADLLICESSFPNAQKVSGHLSPSSAGRIAHSAGVRHLVLTHFYPPCEQVDMISECRQTYTGKVTLAEDLMQFQLN